jgi:hypothetical protein
MFYTEKRSASVPDSQRCGYCKPQLLIPSENGGTIVAGKVGSCREEMDRIELVNVPLFVEGRSLFASTLEE